MDLRWGPTDVLCMFAEIFYKLALRTQEARKAIKKALHFKRNGAVAVVKVPSKNPCYGSKKKKSFRLEVLQTKSLQKCIILARKKSSDPLKHNPRCKHSATNTKRTLGLSLEQKKTTKHVKSIMKTNTCRSWKSEETGGVRNPCFQNPFELLIQTASGSTDLARSIEIMLCVGLFDR